MKLRCMEIDVYVSEVEVYVSEVEDLVLRNLGSRL